MPVAGKPPDPCKEKKKVFLPPHPPPPPKASARVPDDAWEFHARKNANDAAYQGLDFAPYCSTMPVVPPPPTATTAVSSNGNDAASAASLMTAVPKWAWKKKAPR